MQRASNKVLLVKKATANLPEPFELSIETLIVQGVKTDLFAAFLNRHVYRATRAAQK
jgi:hypothetical protein